jgi:hypothetical protein
VLGSFSCRAGSLDPGPEHINTTNLHELESRLPDPLAVFPPARRKIPMSAASFSHGCSSPCQSTVLCVQSTTHPTGSKLVQQDTVTLRGRRKLDWGRAHLEAGISGAAPEALVAGAGWAACRLAGRHSRLGCLSVALLRGSAFLLCLVRLLHPSATAPTLVVS